MQKILVMGALGQVGLALTLELCNRYGDKNVIASDIREPQNEQLATQQFEIHDCTHQKRTAKIVEKYNINIIYNLPALLSKHSEQDPQNAFEVNLVGIFKTLEIARIYKCAVFTPSTIAAFGPSTPKKNTPQETIIRPNTMYGITKAAGELLCDYYYFKYGVDTRGLRYPGIISPTILHGAGTTDYAVDIFHDAVKKGHYKSYIQAGVFLDMMYMPDAVRATIDLMEADSTKLQHRNAYNISAMNFDVEILANEIKKHIPHFSITYEIDPLRQKIASSWPKNVDDSCARNDWGWSPTYDLKQTVEDMLKKIRC